MFRIFLCICLLAGCGDQYKTPHVLVETSAGDIVIELFVDKAPKTTEAFLRYVDAGYYKNASFYRVLSDDNQPMNAPKAELIQGGLYRSANRRDSLPGIPHESTQQSGIRHQNGTVSMARLEPGTATTEFFICIGDQPGFDFGGENNPDKQGYAAFGKVVNGMDVVRKIYHRPETDQSFDPPVPIYNIRRL